MLDSVLELIDKKRKELNPQYVRNGKPVYKLTDYKEMTDLDGEMLINGGMRNPAERVPVCGVSGNLLRTPRLAYATNHSIMFDNRVKVDLKGRGETREKVYTFVIDQRALAEQASGHIYANFVVGYVIGKGEDGNPVVREVVHIKEDEFINEYDSIFDVEEMPTIMEIINSYRSANGTAKIINSLDL